MQTPDFTPMVIPVIWLNSHPGSKRRRMDCNYELGHTAPYADSLYLFVFPHSGNTVTFKFQHAFSWGSSSTFSRNHVGLNVLWKHAWRRDINLGWLDQKMLPREGGTHHTLNNGRNSKYNRWEEKDSCRDSRRGIIVNNGKKAVCVQNVVTASVQLKIGNDDWVEWKV